MTKHNRRGFGRLSTIALWLVRIGAIATIAWVVFLAWALFNLAFGQDWTWHRDRAVLCALAYERVSIIADDAGEPVQTAINSAHSMYWTAIALEYPRDNERASEINAIVWAVTPPTLLSIIETYCQEN